MQAIEADPRSADLELEVEARQRIAATNFYVGKLVEAQQVLIADLERKNREFSEEASRARRRARDAEDLVARLQVQVAKLQMRLGIERTKE